jgi:hypothetical protein
VYLFRKKGERVLLFEVLVLTQMLFSSTNKKTELRTKYKMEGFGIGSLPSPFLTAGSRLAYQPLPTDVHVGSARRHNLKEGQARI